MTRIAGPAWRAGGDAGLIQADALILAVRSGYCDRHADWIAELVGWHVREARARRQALARATLPQGGG